MMKKEKTTATPKSPKTKTPGSRPDIKKTAKSVPNTASKRGTKTGIASKTATTATGMEKARAGTKKAMVLELLRRKKGAATSEIGKATGWQNHSIRSFISGTVTKKMGLAVQSFKSENGKRTYRIVQ